MTADPDAEKVQALFLAASELDGPDRQALLNQECPLGSPLRNRVVQLLEAHDASDSLLDQSISAATEDLFVPTPGASRPTEKKEPHDRPAGVRSLPAMTGSQIGPYTVIEEIGHGGMGVVYAAEQSDPVRRCVALKVIKPGMDSRNVIARFEVERQALSLMDHPHIAKVLDAGTTATGLPFFAMELVQGQPITQYCDEQQLSIRERLLLFVPICKAIQHAHQKGIIHRDIKPSNILIAEYDGRLAPKVIDFGVAKALHQPLTEGTMFTEVGQIVGTPEYLSPEQAMGNPAAIDTRSDVYSLGVLLYELLAGVTPFDGQRLRAAAWDEMLRIVREEEPPRPSSRLSSSTTLQQTGTNRQSEAGKLAGLLRGELDWIVMRALEKDQSRRYETANALAEDIQRYLDDEPVHACPPSRWYRAAKFTKRNKSSVAAIAFVAAAMVLTTIISSVLAVRASRAEQVAARELQRALGAEQQAREEAARAQSQEAIATAISDFLRQDLFPPDLPGEAPDPHIELSTVVRHTARLIMQHRRFEGQPLVEASIHDVLSDVYGPFGGGGGMMHLNRAHELYFQELGPEHPKTLVALRKCAFYRDEIETLEQVLDSQRRLLGNFHPDTLATMVDLARQLEAAGRIQAALAMIEPVIAHYESQEADHVEATAAMGVHARLLSDSDRPSETLNAYEKRRRIAKYTERRGEPSIFAMDNNLAVAHPQPEDYAEAIERLVPPLNHAYRRWALDFPLTNGRLRDLHRFIEEHMKAVAHSPSNHEGILEIMARLQGQMPDNPVVWTATGMAYHELGDWPQAIEALEKSVELSGGGTVMEWFLLSLVYAQAGNPEAAKPWFEQALTALHQNESLAIALQSLKHDAAQALRIPYAASSDVRTAWRTEMQQRATQMKVTDVAEQALTLHPRLLHEYRDIEQGIQQSMLWSWSATGRPIALGASTFKGWMGSNLKAAVELVSLADQPFVALRDGMGPWSPRQAGITLQPVPNVASPAEDEEARKVQMHELFARLDAEVWTSTGWSRLELTADPACRYADSKVLDGAVFLFMENSNPEIAAVIEARRQEDGSVRWEWAFAKMTTAALSVSSDEQQVWADAGGPPSGCYLTIGELYP